MEKLEKSRTITKRALNTLEQSFVLAKQAENEKRPEYVILAQDSMVKHFEYSYDTFWKFLKIFLEQKMDITSDEIKSPKSVFRLCVHLNLCSPQEGETLIQMVNDRNITTHSYDIQQVHKIIPCIKEYYVCMLKIIEHIESKL